MNWLIKLLKTVFESVDNPPPPPLTTYAETVNLTPNKGGKIVPKFIIIHHSEGSFAGGVSWIKNPASKVSYHYLIDRAGRRVQLVYDTFRAWHAGESRWGIVTDLNTHSVGISFCGNTYERPPSAAEIDSCAEKCLYLMDKFGIPVSHILAHRQVSPGRKDDPSPATMSRLFTRIAARQEST